MGVNKLGPAATSGRFSLLSSNLRGANGSLDVGGVAKVIPDIQTIKEGRQAPEGHAHAVWAGIAAELPTAFKVRLKIEKYPRRSNRFHAGCQFGRLSPEIAQHQIIAAVAVSHGYKVLEPFFIDVSLPSELGVDAIILDVHP